MSIKSDLQIFIDLSIDNSIPIFIDCLHRDATNTNTNSKKQYTKSGVQRREIF